MTTADMKLGRLSPFQGLRAVVGADVSPWPMNPYKGLSYYTAADALLFAGREAVVDECAKVLGTLDTRILLFHGATGSGKSSFLRAGLIPFLEQPEHGYSFRSPQELTPTGLFVRSTDRPLAKLADAIYELASHQYSIQTPTGKENLDLSPALLGYTEREAFQKGVCGNVERIIEALMSLASLSPRKLVLVVDQAEECITVRPGPDGDEARELFFDFLARFSQTRMNLKVIVAMRTEYYGRFHDEIQEREWDLSNIRDFLLRDLSSGEIERAILRPTSKEPLNGYGAPYEQYHFEYEAGLAATIAKDLTRSAREGGVLAVMQMVCGRLYRNTKKEMSWTITSSDYNRFGRVEGQVDAHLEETLRDLAKSNGISSHHGQERESERWRIVLDSLVSSQRDGSVTTTFKTRRELENEARDAGCKIKVDAALPFLAQEEHRIIQTVEVLNPDTNEAVERFSLGHDALGLALRNWNAAYKTVAEARKKLKRQGLVVGVLAVVALGTAVLFYRAVQANRRLRALDLAAAAVKNSELDPERGVLLALQAATLASGPVNQSPSLEIEDALRRALGTSPERQTFEGRENELKEMYTVAWSPSGDRVAAADWSGTVKIWHAASGGELMSKASPTKVTVWDLAYSPSGRFLAIAREDGNVKVWDLATGRDSLTLVHYGPVYKVAYSPDGKFLASASGDGLVKIWDAGTGRFLFSLEHRDTAKPVALSAVKAVAFSSDSRRVVTGTEDGTARIWDLASPNRAVCSFNGHRTRILSVAFSYDALYAASGDWDGVVNVWYAKNCAPHKTVAEHPGPVYGVAFDSSGTTVGSTRYLLATAGYDATARILDAQTGKELRSLRGHNGPIMDVAFNSSGSRLATASWDRTVKVWHTSDLEFGPLYHEAAVIGVQFSSDSKRIISLSRRLHVWAVDSGYRHSLEKHRGGYDVAASSAGTIATAQLKGVVISPISSDSTARTIDTTHALAVAFSPDGKRFATVNDDSTASVWDATTGERITQTPRDNDVLRNVAFSPDGNRIVSTGNTAIMWDATTGRQLASFAHDTAHLGAAVFSAAFTPDGDTLATGDQNGTILIWAVNSPNKPIRTLVGHKYVVSAIAFSPDGRRMASASRDMTVRVWDAHTGRELFILSDHTSAVNDLAFSPDGSRLASASSDSTVLIHPLRIEMLKARAYARAGRALTSEECSQYLNQKRCPQSAMDLIVEARKQARDGNVDQAIDRFRAAQKLDSSLSRSQIAQELRDHASMLALKGMLEAAVAAHQQALEFEPALRGDLSDWNHLCWYGALWEKAAVVMDACNVAVGLAERDPRYRNSLSSVRDSRGVARALTGDVTGAKADFGAFVSDVSQDKISRDQRRSWIRALDAGRSPFTRDLLQELRIQ